jgi:membrane fusion protein, heavy metal efflux system
MKHRALIVVAGLVIVGSIAGLGYLRPNIVSLLTRMTFAGGLKNNAAKADQPGNVNSRAEMVPGDPNAIRLPPDVVRALGITTATASEPKESGRLILSGSLALDSNRLAHVHTRFIGEVVELGTTRDKSAGTEGGHAIMKQIRFGDWVEQGQVLAVLWSSDLGEKKSEYLDTLSRLRLEQETFARLEKLYKNEAIPERSLREQRRAVESAEIAVARVERTLYAWRLTDEEIAAIKSEAELMKGDKAPRDGPVEKSWARVELRAPLAGNILEKNLTVGDIVDTTTDLFKIADLRYLCVWANVYEEDIPVLMRLPKPIQWRIKLKSDPTFEPLAGRVERIGDIIDPNQHTAIVAGRVENPDGWMRAGQFISATIDLPPTPGEVEVPSKAVIEDSEESVLFIQPSADQPVYRLQPVSILRRSGELAYVRGVKLSESAAGEEFPLRSGDRVVSSGALELKAALNRLQTAVMPSR